MLFTERIVFNNLGCFTCVSPQIGGEHSSIYNEHASFLKQVLGLPPSLFDMRTKGGARAIPFFSPSWGPSFFSSSYVLLVFSVFLIGGQGPERSGRGMAHATDNHPNHNKSASNWFFMCGFCRVVLLMSSWGGGVKLLRTLPDHPLPLPPTVVGNENVEHWRPRKCFTLTWNYGMRLSAGERTISGKTKHEPQQHLHSFPLRPPCLPDDNWW